MIHKGGGWNLIGYVNYVDTFSRKTPGLLWRVSNNMENDKYRKMNQKKLLHLQVWALESLF